MASLISAVEAGVGVGLAGDRFGHLFGQRVKILPRTPEPKLVPIGLTAPKARLTPATEKFWECAQQVLSIQDRGTGTDGQSGRKAA